MIDGLNEGRSACLHRLQERRLRVIERTVAKQLGGGENLRPMRKRQSWRICWLTPCSGVRSSCDMLASNILASNHNR